MEIQVFFFLENGLKLTEIRPLEMVADHHHLLGGFVSADTKRTLYSGRGCNELRSKMSVRDTRTKPLATFLAIKLFRGTKTRNVMKLHLSEKKQFLSIPLAVCIKFRPHASLAF